MSEVTRILLLDHGAALNPLENVGTPLSVAVQFDHVEAVKFLLQRRAKPDLASPQNSMTSLHWAATLGRANIARILLEAGTSVDSDSGWRQTPLHAADS